MTANLNTETRDCPICNEAARFVFVSKHGRDIFECGSAFCGHFFTPMRESEQGICERDTVIERESDQDLAIYGERNERLLERVMLLCPSTGRPLRLLDFGAGNAHTSRTFKAKLGESAQVFCFEPNQNCHRLYARNGLVHVETLEAIPASLDLIYMIEVVEHLEEPISILRFLRTKLGGSGHLFLSTPHGSRHERSTNAYETRSHLHFFTDLSLNLALSKAGFAPIEFAFLPEMYPRPGGPAQRAAQALRAALVEHRVLLSSWTGALIGARAAQRLRKPFHLVGATRPIAEGAAAATVRAGGDAGIQQHTGADTRNPLP